MYSLKWREDNRVLTFGRCWHWPSLLSGGMLRWLNSGPGQTKSRPALAGESWAPSREKIPPRLQNAKTGSTSYARGELYISEYNRHYTLQYNLQSAPKFRGRTELFLCTFLYCFNRILPPITTNNPFISRGKVIYWSSNLKCFLEANTKLERFIYFSVKLLSDNYNSDFFVRHDND